MRVVLSCSKASDRVICGLITRHATLRIQQTGPHQKAEGEGGINKMGHPRTVTPREPVDRDECRRRHIAERLRRFTRSPLHHLRIDLLGLFCALALLSLIFPISARAVPSDRWWNEAWPYRIGVTVESSGVARVSIDFTAAFQKLGLNGALLDVRSIRVVRYTGKIPDECVPYQETYSTVLENAEEPQIGWSSDGVYWTVNDGSAQADKTRFSEGTGSLKATIKNVRGGYGYPGVELHIAGGEPLSDWRKYEVLTYDVWPKVNASAIDQAPDLYYFKLYNTKGCAQSDITQGGPPLALNRWNPASVSLKPFHTCTTPSFDNITRMEFHTRDNETVSGRSGLWDDGDQLTLWFDNMRLVDQDGGGAIKWNAEPSKYYIYFDVLEHEGHPAPSRARLGPATVTAHAGPPESGGYYHRIRNAVTDGLKVWSAPPTEKILKTHVAPVARAPLRIQASRNEFEPFQLVVRSSTSRNLSCGISDFVKGGRRLTASQVTLHRVDYVPVTQLSDHFGRLGDWPDPLYPLAMEESVLFTANVNQPLWFTVYIPRGTEAGIYTASVHIGDASIPVELEVWDFTLPDAIDLEGEWGFGWSSVVEVYKGTMGGNVQPCYWTLVDTLYNDFASHRLTPKGVGWPAGLNYPGGVAYDCNGNLDPDAWGDWDFQTLSERYLSGNGLDNGVGFPAFLIRGPNSNWPPESRPSSFCGESRGAEPPGNSGYNAKWFQYWTAVSDYLGNTADYAAKGIYHIVNEPQTGLEAGPGNDYDIVAYLAQQTKSAAPHVRILVSEQVESAIYNNPRYPGAKIDIWMPTITNYESERAHDRQLNHGEDVWWYFLYGDRPPLPNPTVMDRPGIEARIIPWLAWLDRIRGLAYYSTTDWSPSPWTQPWLNAGNGDGFLFYPPKDGSIAFNACNAQSNRLVPSIRWELLREGMEDYEYFWLLNAGNPQIGTVNEADRIIRRLVDSRTRFSRVPIDLYRTRSAVAAELTAPANP